MKTSTVSETYQIPFIAIILVLALSAPPVLSQEVVIEGGPDKIQISDQDGEREEATVRDAASTPASVVPTRREFMTVEPIPGSDVTVNVPVEETTPETGLSNLTEEPEREATLPVVEVERYKQLDRLADQLGISESATSAQVTMDASEVFIRGEARVTPALEDTFEQLGNYLTLSDWENGVLVYYFDEETESSTEARQRAESFAKYLGDEVGVTEVTFRVASPITLRELRQMQGENSSTALLTQPALELSMR